MTEMNENKREDEAREDAERKEDGAPRGTGADITDEFRPEPVPQRESQGQQGPAEGPQVAPDED
jgi:hypothetical protein